MLDNGGKHEEDDEADCLDQLHQTEAGQVPLAAPPGVDPTHHRLLCCHLVVSGGCDGRCQRFYLC